MTESHSMENVMFIVGAQATADGDMLPETFTVFSRVTGPEEAIRVIVGKIIEDLVELEIEDARGMVVFKPIETWEEFAEVEVHDHVKMEALAVAIALGYMEILHSTSERITDLVTMPWVPCSD